MTVLNRPSSQGAPASSVGQRPAPGQQSSRPCAMRARRASSRHPPISSSRLRRCRIRAALRSGTSRCPPSWRWRWPDQQRRLITPRPHRPSALLARVHWRGPSRTVADPRAKTPCDDPAPGLQHVAALKRVWGDDLRSPDVRADVRTGHSSTAASPKGAPGRSCCRRHRPSRRSPDYFGYSAGGEPSLTRAWLIDFRCYCS